MTHAWYRTQDALAHCRIGTNEHLHGVGLLEDLDVGGTVNIPRHTPRGTFHQLGIVVGGIVAACIQRDAYIIYRTVAVGIGNTARDGTRSLAEADIGHATGLLGIVCQVAGIGHDPIVVVESRVGGIVLPGIVVGSAAGGVDVLPGIIVLANNAAGDNEIGIGSTRLVGLPLQDNTLLVGSFRTSEPFDGRSGNQSAFGGVALIHVLARIERNNDLIAIAVQVAGGRLVYIVNHLAWVQLGLGFEGSYFFPVVVAGITTLYRAFRIAVLRYSRVADVQLHLLLDRGVLRSRINLDVRFGADATLRHIAAQRVQHIVSDRGGRCAGNPFVGNVHHAVFVILVVGDTSVVGEVHRTCGDGRLQMAAQRPAFAAKGLAGLVGLDAVDVGLRVGDVFIAVAILLYTRPVQRNLLAKLVEAARHAARHRHARIGIRLVEGGCLMVVIALIVLVLVLVYIRFIHIVGLDIHIDTLVVPHRAGNLNSLAHRLYGTLHRVACRDGGIVEKGVG